MPQPDSAPHLSSRQHGQVKRLLAARRVLSSLPIKGKRTLATYITRMLAPDVHLVEARVGGYTRTLDIQDRVQRWMFFELYDADETTILAKLLRPGGCFLDIGANVGWYTLAAAQLVGSGGTVHAFEPVPANVDILEATLRRNGLDWVKVEPVAVSDAPGSIDLHLPDTAGESGWATAAKIQGGTTLKVPAVTIDQYVESLPAVSAAKIDVEGFEPPVLKGMQSLLARDHPALLLEINVPMLAAAGFAPSDIAAPLEPHGYRFHQIARGARLRPFSFEGSLEEEVTNILAVIGEDAL